MPYTRWGLYNDSPINLLMTKQLYVIIIISFFLYIYKWYRCKWYAVKGPECNTNNKYRLSGLESWTWRTNIYIYIYINYVLYLSIRIRIQGYKKLRMYALIFTHLHTHLAEQTHMIYIPLPIFRDILLLGLRITVSFTCIGKQSWWIRHCSFLAN